MSTFCKKPEVALRTGLFLLTQSGIAGRVELDLDIHQIADLVNWFGGVLELTRNGDDDNQQFLTYHVVVNNMTIVSHLIINNLTYILQREAFSAGVVYCRPGDKFVVVDDSYLLP